MDTVSVADPSMSVTSNVKMYCSVDVATEASKVGLASVAEERVTESPESWVQAYVSDESVMLLDMELVPSRVTRVVVPLSGTTTWSGPASAVSGSADTRKLSKALVELALENIPTLVLAVRSLEVAVISSDESSSTVMSWPSVVTDNVRVVPVAAPHTTPILSPRRVNTPSTTWARMMSPVPGVSFRLSSNQTIIQSDSVAYLVTRPALSLFTVMSACTVPSAISASMTAR